MLVLSRKPGQSIVIAGEIEISIVEIGRGRVQVGVSAPPHVTIHRNEIHERIQQEATSPTPQRSGGPLAERLARILQPASVCN